jgi:hypothetical protein
MLIQQDVPLLKNRRKRMKRRNLSLAGIALLTAAALTAPSPASAGFYVIPVEKKNGPLPQKTGQTKCAYDASGAGDWAWDPTCTQAGRPPGQDGELQKGAALPTPRFTDNGNGTVTDNLTQLVWLKKANCGGVKSWAESLTFATDLHDGWTGDGNGGDCGLQDGSTAGQWRLPNINELLSLINWSYVNPALSNAAGNGQWTEGDLFSGVQKDNEAFYYWSSTSYGSSVDAGAQPYPAIAWNISLLDGTVSHEWPKSYYLSIWPVRDRR